MPKVDLGKSGPGIQYWLPKMDWGSIFGWQKQTPSTFGCQNWTRLAKNGPVQVAKMGLVHFWQVAKNGLFPIFW